MNSKSEIQNRKFKISVVAIFYNSAPYVSKCVDSILRQTGEFDLELIAVDDCSSDDTYVILTSYADTRLKIIRHEKNAGISAARNTGLKHITGNAFYFIDGDDFLPDGALSVLAEHFSDDSDWVQGGYAICNEQGKRLSVKNNVDGVYGSHEDIVSHFDSLEFVYTHNRLINAKWQNLCFLVGKAHEDRFWNVQAFPLLKKIINVSTVTYNYVAHPASFSNKSRASQLYVDSALELLAKMDKLEACWSGISDTFLITAIEKNLYLWKQSRVYRKMVLEEIRDRSRRVSLNIGAFPRFTKWIHEMIIHGYPDEFIELVAILYRIYVLFSKKAI